MLCSDMIFYRGAAGRRRCRCDSFPPLILPRGWGMPPSRKSSKPGYFSRLISRAFDRSDPSVKVLQDLTLHVALFGLAVWSMCVLCVGGGGQGFAVKTGRGAWTTCANAGPPCNSLTLKRTRASRDATLHHLAVTSSGTSLRCEKNARWGE